MPTPRLIRLTVGGALLVLVLRAFIGGGRLLSTHVEPCQLDPTKLPAPRVLPLLSNFQVTLRKTFGEAISTHLDWETYEGIVRNNDTEGLLAFAREVYFLAVSFATLEPKVPVNMTCSPPILTTPPLSGQCSQQVSNAFNLQVREKPRKVGHAIQLGFDIDNLEILLHELIDVVDKIFIVEWTMPHNRRMGIKPLAWEAVKVQPRFAFALDQVVHFILDDVDSAYIDPNDSWSIEHLQETRRWEKILEWNSLTQFFSDNDLIGFGDTDEIPSRNGVHLLKHCVWTNDHPVDFGIWFPMGRINQAYRTDHPIKNHPYTLGDPTFHVFGRAKQFQKPKRFQNPSGGWSLFRWSSKHVEGTAWNVPSRNRGQSENWILGGVHFTHYGYLIYQLLKGMFCTECNRLDTEIKWISWLSDLHSAVKSGNWTELEWEASQLRDAWVNRTVPLEQIDAKEREVIVYLPWFYDCNRDRYSMWEGRPDSRIF